jgi:GNAT superfamily N-acetyltransferase
MNYKIRPMGEDDRNEVLAMMRTFYTSPAVLTDGSDEIYNADIDNCVNDSPYLEGYIFENAFEIQGYAMVAKSFSTEFGRPCIWIEDLYIKEEFRNQGLGSGFFKFIEEKYSGAIFRLEAEEENKTAIKVYKKAGFDILPYVEMKKL